MARLMTPDEIENIKADKNLQNKLKAELEELAQIGKPLTISIDGKSRWTRLSHRVATEDAIRIFCDGTGDFNPLYRSRDYAKKSVYGRIIAPPQFLTAISLFGGAMYNEYGGDHETIRHMFNSGHQAEYYHVIEAGDEFSVVEIQTEVKNLTRDDTAVQLLACAKKLYINQRHEVVAIVDTTIMMMPLVKRGEMYESVRRRPPKVRHFTEQEVERWYELMLEEPIRGNNPQFWEDINIGDQIPPIHQVYSATEHAAFMVAGGYDVTADWRDRMRVEYLGKNWHWNTKIDVESGLPDMAIGHLQDSTAQLEGNPRAYCGGTQMTCWIYNLITNWMGDTGFLKKINHEYRRFLWRESLVLCKGKVEKKYTEGDEHLVDISTTLEDHNGDFQIPNGTATVILPTRNVENSLNLFPGVLIP